MDDDSTYKWAWHDYFMVHANETEDSQKLLLANAEAFKLNAAQSMVSLGPGSGQLDVGVIETCCKKLELYIGVEPDKHMFDSLSATMKRLQGMEVTLMNDSVPEWSGPKDPVDIVLASNVLFFIKKPIDAIQQFYKWLKPGGSVIFLHPYQFHPFIQLAEECDIPWPTTYLMPDLKKDLDKEGFLKFEERKFECHWTISPQNEDFVRSYFQTWLGNVQEDKMQRFLKALKDRWQGKEVPFEYTFACIRVTKPHSV